MDSIPPPVVLELRYTYSVTNNTRRRAFDNFSNNADDIRNNVACNHNIRNIRVFVYRAPVIPVTTQLSPISAAVLRIVSVTRSAYIRKTVSEIIGVAPVPRGIRSSVRSR
jgi:hypothetical protein